MTTRVATRSSIIAVILPRTAAFCLAAWLACFCCGCEKDNASSSSGGGSSGNCVEDAKSIDIGMTSAQVIKIMGSPDSDVGSYDGSERQMIWTCGTHGVLVDFQPGDSVFLVLGDGSVIKQGTWSVQDGYGK